MQMHLFSGILLAKYKAEYKAKYKGNHIGNGFQYTAQQIQLGIQRKSIVVGFVVNHKTWYRPNTNGIPVENCS